MMPPTAEREIDLIGESYEFPPPFASPGNATGYSVAMADSIPGTRTWLQPQYQFQNTTAAIVAGVEEIAKVGNLADEKVKLEEEGKHLTVTYGSIKQIFGSIKQIIRNEWQILDLINQIKAAGGYNGSALCGMEPAMMNISTALATAMVNGELCIGNINATLVYIDATYRQNGILMDRLEYIYRRFLQFQENETLLNEFIGIANSYGDPASMVKFTYNTLTYPYQRYEEGSCFATAVLDTMWANVPLGYMRFVDKLIREDRADFNVFFSGSNRPKLIVHTPGIGIGAGNGDIYQKSVSALASFETSPHTKQKVSDIVYLACLSEINRINAADKMGMSNGTMCAISDFLAKNLTDRIVWDRQWTPEINVTRSSNEAATVEAMANLIRGIFPMIPKPEAAMMGRPVALAMANAIRQANGESGGFARLLIGNLLGLSGKLDISISTSAQEAIYNVSDVQPLLHALKFGSFSNSSRRLKPGQAILARYASSNKSFHMFTLISGHYDANAMQVGEKIRIGHMNWAFSPEAEGFIYMEKIGPMQVQFTYDYDRIPLCGKNSAVKDIALYPDVFTEYE
jgi:hypothetical protein